MRRDAASPGATPTSAGPAPADGKVVADGRGDVDAPAAHGGARAPGAPEGEPAPDGAGAETSAVISSRGREAVGDATVTMTGREAADATAGADAAAGEGAAARAGAAAGEGAAARADAAAGEGAAAGRDAKEHHTKSPSGMTGAPWLRPASPGVTVTVIGRGALELGAAATLTAHGAPDPALARTEPAAVDTNADTAPARGPADADSADDAPRIPPSLYARFEAFRLLGRGGAGEVYRARDFRLGRDVAIKLLFGADPERGTSLLREARSQARLAHENVCEIYEAGVADHVRFIVMQLIDGAPLDRAKAELTLEGKVRVVRQIASALHAAHQLGLIHRDVKPSNIMVERGDDGARKPYIMDFGLAREAGDSGRTTTGAIMGTPSFMAPEQALGKIRSLDRRTDVYGLGATLYDLVAGRPPFVADSVLGVLEKVRAEEAPPLRALDRNVPRDLEAIVARCLEKEPGARYASARALGDDLQRFLDGDPVAARRGALGYVLVKRAKRHKAKAALAAAALFAALLVAGVWLRGRRIAAEQATLSRELGESVKEMELFLRAAHGMPLHDVERERDVVRARLRDVEARMRVTGRAGKGPGHYALGRGRLALQEPQAALEHLEQAAAAGYRSPGLDYALGLALSALYKKALDDTKRIETAALRAARVAAIEAQYKRPALERLRAALSGAIEAPAYAEGLIAFYEGRHEEALAKAREAYEKAPWLFEAKKLEGDALFAIGSRFGHDAAFDYGLMSHWFDQAADAYRAAADQGRSDPAVHEAACELWTQSMNGAFEHGAPVRPCFEAATKACGRAIAASSRNANGYVKLALAHQSFAWRVATGEVANEDPEAAIVEAVARADEAARRSAADPFTHYLAASGWRTRALHAQTLGLSVFPAIDHSILAYERALQLDPGFLWAMNELCSSLTMRAQEEALRGLDPEPSLRAANAHCDRAIEIDPGFLFPKANKVISYLLRAEYLVAVEHSPADAVRDARRVIDSTLDQSSSIRLGPYWRATSHRIEAEYALLTGGQADLALRRAEAEADELERHLPSSSIAFQVRGEAAAVRARWSAAQGRDPSHSLRVARDAFARAIDAKPLELGLRVWASRVAMDEIRWSIRDAGTRVPAPIRFDAVLNPLLPLLEAERADPALYQTMAELHELRASWRLRLGLGTADDVANGLAWARQALAVNPRLPAAARSQARLLAMRERGPGQAPAGSKLTWASLRRGLIQRTAGMQCGNVGRLEPGFEGALAEARHVPLLVLRTLAEVLVDNELRAAARFPAVAEVERGVRNLLAAVVFNVVERPDVNRAGRCGRASGGGGQRPRPESLFEVVLLRLQGGLVEHVVTG